MAASYVTTYSEPALKVFSQTQFADTERVYANTVPHGVPFWAYIPKTSFMKLSGDAMLEQLATAIEGLLSSGGASSASMIEDTDENGLITDLVRFTLSIPGDPTLGANFTTTVDIPVVTLTDTEGFIKPNAATMISEGFAALNHIAGL